MQNKYKQLKIGFISDFVLGKYLPGTYLPSERDIARENGISRVSVRHAIEDLLSDGYIEKKKNGRNVVCGSPIESSSRKLLLLLPNFCPFLNEIYQMLYQAIVLKCRLAGISLACGDLKSVARLEKKNLFFDAAVGIGIVPEQKLKMHCTERFLTLDKIENGDYFYISTDNYEGGKMAAEQLLQCHCHHAIALKIAGTESYLPFSERERGFVSVMNSHGVPVTFCETPNSSPVSCFGALQRCAELVKADGMFVNHDYLAVNAIQALKELEISVPGQMSLIGFDGLPFGEYLLPSLTTIEQPVNAIADKLLELAFAEKLPAEDVYLPPRLILRKSTRKE